MKKKELAIFEIEVLVAVLCDTRAKKGLHIIGDFLDASFIDTEYADFHFEKHYKNYNYSNLHKIEKDGIYKKGNTYTFRIRTLSESLAKHFIKTLQIQRSKSIQGLLARYWEVKKFPINNLYSITPAIMKNDGGYWKTAGLNFEDYIKRLEDNAWKKYKYFTDKAADENIELFTRIEFTNRNPVPTEYKNITLLGDKLLIEIDSNSVAQDIAYMLLGTGILENGASGFGYCNPKWNK